MSKAFKGIFVVMFLACGGNSEAAASFSTIQAPGFYRMMLGAFEITALNDGVAAWPPLTKLLTNVTSDEIDRGLSESCLTEPVHISYNQFLINTGSKLVLIDAGSGGSFDDIPTGHGLNRLLANLRAAGYEPRQVNEIYITHMHFDHIGGLMLGKQRTFPNAILRVAKNEMDYWLDPANRAASNPGRAMFQLAVDSLEPYIKAKRFSSFSEDTMLVPGVRALATHGHTPGHTSYVVESDGQTLVILGDLVEVGAVQFPYPSTAFVGDQDPNAATAQRERVFQVAIDKSGWVAGAHLAFPGIGHVRAGERRYFWVPIEYTIPHR